MTANNVDASYPDRQKKLEKAITEMGLQGIALNSGPSLTYLTGLHFHLSERPVVVVFTPGQVPVIVLPELETGKLSSLTFPFQEFAYGENPETWHSVFRDAVREVNLQEKEVGIEPTRMRVLELSYLDINHVSGEACLEKIRIRKDTAEITAMQAAVDIAQEALQSAMQLIKRGITERELAAEITVQLLRNGSESELPFTPIVASGPNSANPHSFPTERSLQRGDMLIIDWGANVGGYYSDLTRTYSIGRPDEEMKTIAKVVQQANSEAREIAGPGVTAQEVDRAARRVIEEAGYGEFFIHRTGHGLGLEGHEAPYIREGNMMVLEPGMIFTIEPGIYLPGRGGVRIEDDVVVTDQGLHSFSDLPRELDIIEF